MKLLAIDGNSLINRAFYGIKMLTTKNGQYTNAIYGFINISHRLEEMESPDGVVVAFDLKAPTFRHLKYDAYKAGRHPSPPELLSQFPYAKDCLAAMGAKVLELYRFRQPARFRERVSGAVRGVWPGGPQRRDRH